MDAHVFRQRCCGVLICLLMSGPASVASQTLPAAASLAGSASSSAAPSFKLRVATGPTAVDPGWPSTLLLAGLAAAGGWTWWRRWARKRLRVLATARPTTSTLQRLHSQALTPQASVHAVRWNGEDFLVACSSHQVTLLARVPTGGADGAQS